MAYTTINKPNTQMNPVLYTGNESTNVITTGLANDFVWIKAKDSAGTNHYLFDSVRGVQKNIHSNTNDAEVTEANTLTAFNSTGFTLGSDAQVNGSGQPHISWNWKAGGTAVSNTDGDIASSVSANTTNGFSVVTYTGNGTSGSTIGHGLTSVPSMIIVKRRNVTNGWGVYHKTLGTGSEVYLNLTQAVTNSNFWITTPTTSVFSVSSSDYVNTSSDTYVAYCFAEKKGFSKFSSYIGNGNADGTFVYTGFKPAFIMFKRTNSTSGWGMYDNKRTPFNLMNKRLLANTSGAEDTSADNGINFLSNGFKWKTGSGWNASGGTYIYMAFAQNPLVGTNNVPATAR